MQIRFYGAFGKSMFTDDTRLLMGSGPLGISKRIQRAKSKSLYSIYSTHEVLFCQCSQLCSSIVTSICFPLSTQSIFAKLGNL